MIAALSALGLFVTLWIPLYGGTVMAAIIVLSD
jgi:hypothetical protein